MGGDYQTDRQTDRQTGERENVVDDHVGWQGPARNTRTRTLIHTHTHTHTCSRTHIHTPVWPMHTHTQIDIHGPSTNKSRRQDTQHATLHTHSPTHPADKETNY
mmetsp:Transcript_36884/g.92490  ORF Transcript_36884/g.92490 Transcript_36884/m.92490 type:complete len:104 (+) Transcript_36884:2-313(+)